MEKLFMRAMSLLLVIAMMITPLTAFADGEEEEVVEVAAQAVEEEVPELDAEPVIEEPVIEEPVIEEPVIEEPVIEEPVVEEPVIEEPVIEEPVVEEPVIEEPVVTEPVVETVAVEPETVPEVTEATEPEVIEVTVEKEVKVEAAGKKYSDGTVDWYIYETGDSSAVTNYITDVGGNTGTVLEIHGSGDVTAYPTGFDTSLLGKVTTLRIGMNDSDDLHKIGASLFNNGDMPNLRFVEIGHTVNNIADKAFQNNPNLNKINVKKSNKTYMDENGILFKLSTAGTGNPTILMQMPAKNSAVNYELPYTVKTINDFALEGCKNLNTLSLEENTKLESIGVGAFFGSGLSSFTIPAAVTELKSSTFASTQLASINIPSTVKIIDESVFENCKLLKKVNIPTSVHVIADHTFAGCTALPSIELHNLITTLGKGAFDGCTKLEIVKIPEKVTAIPEECFKDCAALSQVIIPGTVKNIKDDAFRGCIGLNEIIYGGDETDWSAIVIGSGNALLTAAPRTYANRIVYDLRSGENNPGNPSTYMPDELPIDLKDPTRKGCTFQGWYKDAAYTVRVYDIPHGTTGPVTLHAKWAWKTYSIQYVMNGGKNPATNPTTYKYYDAAQADPANLTDPTRSGYHFEGWFTDSACTKAFVKDLDRTGTLTLYAKWSAAKHRVELDPKNGEAKYSLEFDFEQTLALPKPTRAGYTFEGWYDAAKTPYTQIARGTNKNLSLEAHWKLRNFTITYHANGGKLSTLYPATYTINSEIDFEDYTTYPKPVRGGYIFGGWFKDISLAKPLTKIVKGSTGNLELYPKWTARVYTINFNSNGGSHQDDILYTIEKGVTLPTCKRAGYTFLGWYNGTTKVTSFATGTAGNKNLIAKWKLNEYKITYHLNGGTGSSNPSTITVKDTVTIKNPTKKGYTFAGWYVDSSYKTKLADNKLENITANVDLYAKWTAVKYTITYMPDGGTMPTTAKTVYNVASSFTLPSPTKKGYTFLGWYKEASFVNKVSSISAGTTGNKTFYAKWSLNKYTITYGLNGGVNHADNPATYTILTGLNVSQLSDPVRRGYTFEGWFKDSNFQTPFSSATAGNVKIYAKWTAKQYTITFNTKGGNTIAPLKYTVEQSSSLPTPKRTGYTFAGWYKDTGYKTKMAKLEAGTAGNITLYAKWTAVKYTITYSLDGGTLPTTAKTTYTISSPVTFVKPTRAGYTFDGWWNASVKAAGSKVTSTSDFSLGNITVYAKWTKK